MARYLGKHEGIDVSHNFVAVLWRENGIQPHRQGTFKVNIQLPAPVWRFGDVTCLSWFAMRSFRVGLAWRLHY